MISVFRGLVSKSRAQSAQNEKSLPVNKEDSKKKKNMSFSCCICMVEAPEVPEDDSPLALLNEDGRLISLNELEGDTDTLRGGHRVGAEQVIFASACGEHAICNYCLHRLATNTRNHPVGPQHPLIPCPYPFRDCLTPSTGLPNYFSHAAIEKLLTEEEIERYRVHVARYQFPGYELMACPRPSRYGTMCGAGILVSLDAIRTAETGKLVVVCDQAPRCRRKSCYHCHGLVHRTRDYCDFCVTAIENTNPKLPNHYFYRPGKRVGDGQPGLMLNEELTEEIAISQIKDIVEAERLEIRCIECHIPILKSELCNTLEHCGIERCYSCGRSGTRTRKLGDHWDSSGVKGCPRFDHSIYWNVMAGCKFQCVEGECYNEELGDCDVEEHAAGVEAMVHTRKRAHIYHAIKSLLPELRQTVLDKLWRSPEMRPYLPGWWSSDYRTYTPDTIRQTSIQAHSILEQVRLAETTIDEQTLELAQNIVTKTSALHFTPVEYPPDPEPEQEEEEPSPKAKRKQPLKHEVLFERFKSRYLKRRTPPIKKRVKVSTPMTRAASVPVRL